MKLLCSLLVTIALTGSAAAESYWLEPQRIEPIGRRFVLFKYGTVTLDPGEEETVWLSLAGCPGGVDHIFAFFVQPQGPGAWDYAPRWAYPHSYKGYPVAASIELRNYSAAPMAFKLKLDVRCDE